MLIKVPFSGESEKTRPLVRCIERTAQHTGLTEFQVALVMSQFLEEVCYEVGDNQVVRIPCFGAFGAKAWYPRNDPQAVGYCYPAFSADPPFRNHVRLTCSAGAAAFDNEIDRHRRHAHPSSRKDREARMPGSAHRAFRQQIRAQARRFGYTVELAPER